MGAVVKALDEGAAGLCVTIGATVVSGGAVVGSGTAVGARCASGITISLPAGSTAGEAVPASCARAEVEPSAKTAAIAVSAVRGVSWLRVIVRKKPPNMPAGFASPR